MRSASSLIWTSFQIDRSCREPIFKQITDFFRSKILSGELPRGTRLPGLRTVARQMAISLDTAQRVYRELEEEGLIQASPRSGYFVSHLSKAGSQEIRKSLTVPHSQKVSARQKLPQACVAEQTLSAYGSFDYSNRPFQCFAPLIDEDRDHEWLRLSGIFARIVRQNRTYSSPPGNEDLRRMIARVCQQYRGHALGSFDDIVVTSGVLQGFSLAVRLLFKPGDEFLLESPSWPIFENILRFNGLNPVYVPVDCDGMCVEEAICRHPRARGVFVTPASHNPTSALLSLERRRRLIDWALETGAWIIESDNDGFVWLDDHPCAALRNEPGAEDCVIYLNSFSSLIYPGIDVGFALVPHLLVQSFAGAKAIFSHDISASTQRLLALYLQNSAFETHLRKLIKRFRGNVQVLRECFEEELACFGKLLIPRAGSHAAFLLQGDIEDRRAAEALQRAGVTAWPLSMYSTTLTRPNGFCLGFGSFDEQSLRKSAHMMKSVLQELATA